MFADVSNKIDEIKFTENLIRAANKRTSDNSFENALKSVNDALFYYQKNKKNEDFAGKYITFSNKKGVRMLSQRMINKPNMSFHDKTLKTPSAIFSYKENFLQNSSILYKNKRNRHGNFNNFIERCQNVYNNVY